MTKSEYKPSLPTSYTSVGNSYNIIISVERSNLPSQNMPLCHKDYLELVILFFKNVNSTSCIAALIYF